MTEPALSLWTVYDHPSDFPDTYVAREFLVTAAGLQPTASTIQNDDLAVLRTTLLADFGLCQTARAADDDPKIIETWL